MWCEQKEGMQEILLELGKLGSHPKFQPLDLQEGWEIPAWVTAWLLQASPRTWSRNVTKRWDAGPAHPGIPRVRMDKPLKP